MLDYPLWKKLVVLGVCLWALLYSLVNLLPADSGVGKLVSQRLALGLDLKGGSYLLLEVDVKTYLKDQLANTMDDVRGALRKEKIGYQNLSVKEDGIRFRLREQADAKRISEVVRGVSRDLEVEEKDGEVEISLAPLYVKDLERKVVDQSIEIVRRRIDQTGTREPIIQRQGDDRILLQVPGLENTDTLKRLLGTTAKMTFHLMDEQEPFPKTAVPVGPDDMVLQGERDGYYHIKKQVMLSGDMLVDSQAGFDQMQRPVVNFRFNNMGARKFGEITKENTGKPFAIVLDKHVITAPRINEPILGGSGMISGNFTTESANELALLLRAGALPAPLKVVEERTIGPSLGQDSIDSGKKATLLGAAMVMGVMILCYALFGLIADIALFVNILLIFACLTLFGATLTMPGIAGIVLTFGMSVDANVLIFERIREEIRNGKSPLAAVDHGFQRAYSTIVDTNLTGLISALLLYSFGSGPIKGFAVTLSIGIITSMFSAIMLTRLIIVMWMRKFKPKTLRI